MSSRITGTVTKFVVTRRVLSHQAYLTTFTVCQLYTVNINIALSTLYVLHIGVADHLQPVNGDLWTYAMISESLPVPQFYPNSFKNIVDHLLESSFGLKQTDISYNNIEDVYNFIINNVTLS